MGTPVDVVGGLWDAVYARDWPRIASFLTSESVYYDVPTGPTSAAKGPEGIVARLRLGIEPLAAYEHRHGRITATDDIVMYEHAETWTWPSGETVTLPFVSVHRVAGDHVLLWKDYWDYRTLIDAAPPGWVDSLMQGDLSWMYDATGVE